jgi:esterase/lipase superfamily enzyme
MPDITVFFATNRNPIGDPVIDFGGKLGPVSGRNLRFGVAQVDQTSLKVRSIEVAPEKLVPEQENGRTYVGSQLVLDWLRLKMTKHDRDTLAYIHGFDFSFDEALRRAAELKRFLAADLNLFLFSWPSDGRKIPYYSYIRDREDVQASGEAIGRAMMIYDSFIRSLSVSARCQCEVHLLAHSMGNYALRHAMQYLIKEYLAKEYELRPPRMFDRVFLAAADEDADALDSAEKLGPLPRLCNEVHLYHTPRDLALTISDVTKGNPDRLGADGPANTRSLNDKVSVVDVTPVLGADEDATNHQYYRLNPQVRDDMLAVLARTDPFKIAGREYLQDRRRYRLRARKPSGRKTGTKRTTRRGR